jgi:hypothetical protein
MTEVASIRALDFGSPGWDRFCTDHAVVTVMGTGRFYSAADPDVRLTLGRNVLRVQADTSVPESVTAAARLALAAWARFGGSLTAVPAVRQSLLFMAAGGQR